MRSHKAFLFVKHTRLFLVTNIIAIYALGHKLS